MTFRAQQVFLFIGIFTIVGYVLNFAWEYVQCAPFFRHTLEDPTIRSMFVASAGDILMMFLVNTFVSVISGSYVWFLNAWNFKILLLIAIPSVAVAVLVEFWAFSTARWIYTDQNPTIPGLEISVLPILQMLLINPFAFYVSTKLCRHFAGASNQWRPYEES